LASFGENRLESAADLHVVVKPANHHWVRFGGTAETNESIQSQITQMNADLEQGGVRNEERAPGAPFRAETGGRSMGDRCPVENLVRAGSGG
jgi:hypothetical protein